MIEDSAHTGWFQFVEAPAFARFRDDYLDDDGFAELQSHLESNPEAGDMVTGAGGIRKLRWKDPRRGKGRRGGLRVIYYCFLSEREIWLLALYDKDESGRPDERRKRATEASTRSGTRCAKG